MKLTRNQLMAHTDPKTIDSERMTQTASPRINLESTHDSSGSLGIDSNRLITQA